MTLVEIGGWVESMKVESAKELFEEKALAVTIAKRFGHITVGELVFEELKPYFCKPSDGHWGSLLN